MQVKPIHYDFDTIEINDRWHDMPLHDKVEVHLFYPSIRHYSVDYVPFSFYETDLKDNRYKIAAFYHLEETTETI